MCLTAKPDDPAKWRAVVQHHARTTIDYFHRLEFREEIPEDELLAAVIVELARCVPRKRSLE
jgi:hypothetical protein